MAGVTSSPILSMPPQWPGPREEAKPNKFPDRIGEARHVFLRVTPFVNLGGQVVWETDDLLDWEFQRSASRGHHFRICLIDKFVGKTHMRITAKRLRAQSQSPSRLPPLIVASAKGSRRQADEVSAGGRGKNSDRRRHGGS
jgi:hypothetical protein